MRILSPIKIPINAFPKWVFLVFKRKRCCSKTSLTFVPSQLRWNISASWKDHLIFTFLFGSKQIEESYISFLLCYARVAHKMNKSEIKHIYDNLLVAIIYTLPWGNQMFSVSSSGSTKIRTMKDPHTTKSIRYLCSSWLSPRESDHILLLSHQMKTPIHIVKLSLR